MEENDKEFFTFPTRNNLRSVYLLDKKAEVTGAEDSKNCCLLEPTPIAPDEMITIANNITFNAESWKDDQFFVDLFCQLRDTSSASQNQKSEASTVYNEKAEASCMEGNSFNLSRPLKRQKRQISTDGSLYSQSISGRSESSRSNNNSHNRSSQRELWIQRYQEMVEFRDKYGHCLVPLNWPENQSLSHWVKRQRYQYSVKMEGKHSTLSDERERALEQLGFIWDSHAAAWEERWNELRQFKESNGHCNVPANYPENPQLSIWVKCQRRQFKLLSSGKKSNISPSRISRLLQLGFVFSPRQSNNPTMLL